MSEEIVKETMEERYERVGTFLMDYVKDALDAPSAACVVWGSDLADIGKLLGDLWTERTKFPVSSTLDRLLDHLFLFDEGQRRAETTLGEIEHKGEKVMVKIKVVRGE